MPAHAHNFSRCLPMHTCQRTKNLYEIKPLYISLEVRYSPCWSQKYHISKLWTVLWNGVLFFRFWRSLIWKWASSVYHIQHRCHVDAKEWWNVWAAIEICQECIVNVCKQSTIKTSIVGFADRSIGLFAMFHLHRYPIVSLRFFTAS